LHEENLDRFNKTILENLAGRRTMLTIEQVKKLLSPPMLTVEQVKELQSLLQITPWLDIEPPTLAWPPRDSALDALSRWAQEVFFRMYSMAEENIMKKSKTVNAGDINNEVNSLFQRASVQARIDGANPMSGLKKFIRGLNFFCSEIETQPGKRYERYLELKAKHSS